MTEQTSTKQPWTSKTVVTSFLGIVYGLLMYYGVDMDPLIADILTGEETVTKITEAKDPKGLLVSLMFLLTGYFRLVAKRAIAGGVENVKDVAMKPINWIRGWFKKN